MGVYIKGMRMPKGCDDCRLGDIACEYDEDHADVVCHLVEVFEPHGRLIDADVLRDAVYRHLCIKGEENLLPAERSVFGNIIKAPTVIEAEG